MKCKLEKERKSEIKKITGVFTGSYAEHPITSKKLPIWIADYVLPNYGTGAIMAVPCGDQRDWNFAKYFGIEIINIFELSWSLFIYIQFMAAECFYKCRNDV